MAILVPLPKITSLAGMPVSFPLPFSFQLKCHLSLFLCRVCMCVECARSCVWCRCTSVTSTHVRTRAQPLISVSFPLLTYKNQRRASISASFPQHTCKDQRRASFPHGLNRALCGLLWLFQATWPRNSRRLSCPHLHLCVWALGL